MVDSTILRVSDLNVAARAPDGSMLPIVSDISFAIEPGKVLALIGESGSGKTTISLAAMGYARPGCVITGGIVDLAGTDILSLDFPARRKLRGSDIAYVAQSAAASFNAALRLDLQVTETPIIKGLMSAAEAHDKAVSLYRQLDLPDPETIGQRYPHQVSGGQLQRLMAAMAMICDPKLLILDEPTTALDVTTQIEVLHAFKKLIRERGTSAIYVSHDLAVVAQIADHILVLKDGRMVEYADVEQIVHAPREAYTRELLAAAHILPKSIPAKKPAPLSARQHPLLKVDKVTAAFGRNAEFIALKDVSLELAEARTLGVIGESGSGKTTLGRVIRSHWMGKSWHPRFSNAIGTSCARSSLPSRWRRPHSTRAILSEKFWDGLCSSTSTCPARRPPGVLANCLNWLKCRPHMRAGYQENYQAGSASG